MWNRYPWVIVFNIGSFFGCSKELKYLETLGENQDWHHAFWSRNNTHFAESQAEFCEESEYFYGSEDCIGNARTSAKWTWTMIVSNRLNRSATPVELSTFYRLYLNENQDRHLQYYSEWWKRNVSSLGLGLQAEWHSLSRVLFGWESRPLSTKEWTSGRHRRWWRSALH